jgi:hypothetical protein
MKALFVGLAIGTSPVQNPPLPKCPEGTTLVFVVDFQHVFVAKCAKELFDPPRHP